LPEERPAHPRNAGIDDQSGEKKSIPMDEIRNKIVTPRPSLFKHNKYSSSQK
jgi:hypothetical protein